MNKVCTKCGEEKPATTEFFNKRKEGKFGLRADCRNCHKCACKRRNKLFKEEIKKYNKSYYSEHKEEVRISQSEYNHRPENKLKRNNRFKKKYDSDPQFWLKCKIGRNLRAAIKEQWQSGKTIEELGCSIAFLKVHIESQFQSGMSWDNRGRGGWELDHIRPLSSFDLTDRKQYLAACNYTNIQPLWAMDNLKKGASCYE